MLGHFLVAEALALGRPLAVLARNKGFLTANQRVPAAVRVLVGDLLQPDLGLSQADREWLSQHCDQVLHAGAKVDFLAEPKTGEPYRTNVDGTRHILRLCQELQIDKLAYVSTAYVCGDRDGRISEGELEKYQSFHNAYERSKYVAELLVGNASFLKSPLCKNDR
jgi:thioester reductase-like protein